MTHDGNSGAAYANETNAMTKTEKPTGQNLPDIRLGIQSAQDRAKIAPCADIATAATALKNSDNRVVAAYVPPNVALARRLQAGASVSLALSEWTAEIEALLALRQTHRTRMALFELPRSGDLSDSAQEAFSEQMKGVDWPKKLWAEGDVWLVCAAEFEPFAALALDSHVQHRELIDRLHAATSGDFTELPSRLELLDAGLSALRAAGEEKRVNVERLEDCERKLNENETAARARLDEANNQLVNVTAQVRELEDALSRAQSDLKQSEETSNRQREEARSRQEYLTAQVRELENTLSRTDGVRKDAEAHAKAQLDEANNREEDLTNQVRELEVALLRNEADRKEAEVAAQAQRDEARSQRDQLSVQVQELKEALLLSQTNYRDAEAAAQVRFDKIETQKTDLAERMQELEDRLSRIKAHQRETAAAAQNRIEEAEVQGKLLLQQVTGLQSALLQSEADRNSQKHEKLRLDAAWRRQVRDLSTMLSMLQESTSWRATKPLRTVMSCFRR